MKVHLITYDLLKPAKDYAKLIAELEQLKAVKIEYSVWLLRNNASAEAVRDHLLPFIDDNDRLFVCVLTGEAGWRNLIVSTEKAKQTLVA